MISETRLRPHEIAAKMERIASALRRSFKDGDLKADKESLRHVMELNNYAMRLVYSYLYHLEQQGKLNAGHIHALKEIEDMDEEIRNHSRKGIDEEDYLRRLAAHFEAMNEGRLKEAERREKHTVIAERYAKLAEAHEMIAKAMGKQ